MEKISKDKNYEVLVKEDFDYYEYNKMFGEYLSKYGPIVFIINGYPNSGKTTFEEMVSEKITKNSGSRLRSHHISIIDPVSDVIGRLQIDPYSKDEDVRKLKANIKKCLDDFFNKKNKTVDVLYQKTFYNLIHCAQLNHDLIDRDSHGGISCEFIDMRDDRQCQRAKKEMFAKSVYIENNRVKNVTSNEQDRNIKTTGYDYVVKNNGTMEDLQKEVDKFIEHFHLLDDKRFIKQG